MTTALQRLHDHIEAALFAAEDLPHTREKALAVTRLEEALLWCKRAIEEDAQ